MRIFFAMIGALALAACNTGDVTPQPTPPPVQVACDMSNSVMYDLEIAYSIPASAYISLNSRGQMTEEFKAKAKPALESAFGYLKLVRKAFDIKDAIGFCSNKPLLEAATANAKNIIVK